MLYTDGITEAPNAAAIHPVVVEKVAAHGGGVDQSDDITRIVAACGELDKPAE